MKLVMEDTVVSIEFTKTEFDKITTFLHLSEAETIQDAIIKAIDIAMGVGGFKING